jgi:glycerophosphoryl diester phosphodiesterase
MSGNRLLVIAHRAGNSLDTLQAAEAAGAGWVEADVWAHRGRLEVRHTKTMGPIPLLWDRWRLEPANRPRLTLDALVRAAKPETMLLLDLKGSATALVPLASSTLDQLAPERPYTVCSRNWDLLDAYPRGPHVRVLYSAGNVRELRAALQHLTRPRTDGISIHARLLSAEVVGRLRERAGLVVSWPVNTLALANRLRSWGVDGVSTDRLEIVRALCEKQRPSTGDMPLR